MIEIQGISAHLDFLLLDSTGSPVVLSFYDRSQQIVRSIGGALNHSRKNLCIRKASFPRRSYYICDNSGFDVYISPIVYGKEKFHHGIAISKDVNQNCILSSHGKIDDDFYNFLMKKYDLPLLREWSGPIMRHCLGNGHVRMASSPLRTGAHSLTDSFPAGTGKLALTEICVISCSMAESTLEEDVSALLARQDIRISEHPQKRLAFTDMDSYFSCYGHTLVENLEKQLNPLMGLDGSIGNMCLCNMRLFPQQAAQVNAAVRRLMASSYCILNHGMGVGKTIEGASIVEAYFVEKWMRTNHRKSLRDAYLSPGNINYRAIVMAPGHLVEKWAGEIGREIPYSKVTILRDVSQLVDIKKGGRERNGKEFFIVSKDFAKLSYQRKPLPRIRRSGWLKRKVCGSCGRNVSGTENRCACGCTDIRLEDSGIRASAMVCPSCKNLLVPYRVNCFDEKQGSLDFQHFAGNNAANDKCYYCGESLWVPHVPNIGENKRNVWYRATHYANRAHKATKTVWVHRDFAQEYFSMVGEQPLNVIDADMHFGVRKISPAFYIKRQLNGYFDFAIFDEAHLYKGGGTAQGNAMHALIKASSKCLALTGTIAGGYASHLFYLLYRLDPARMQKKGYGWNSVMKFVDKYGQKETVFECPEASGDYNTNSRGRQIASPKEKPGISPLIFTDFLLDSTMFLDLSDMSKYLPPLKEHVEIVDVPDTIEDPDGNVVENPERSEQEHYRHVLEALKKASREKGGKAILSSMLQFALSYPDHPYGAEKIIHPLNGSVVAAPKSFGSFQDEDVFLAKEKRLIGLINREQAEGRNCFVFAEYTGSPSTCVAYRLKAVIEKHCGLAGKVAVLEASSPSADRREAWIHEKAAEGIKVFITNPRNVETGLDFCFKKDGVLYNYPTLIFYQIGYSLFIVWQASRRHYRLNQREECRTYYMALAGTIQQAVISLIAQKMAATSAIQGKFSVEGLSSMAQGIDVKLKLAQALSNMDGQNGADLQGMFDVLQADGSDDGMYGKFRKMLTLKELIGTALDSIPGNRPAADIIDIFDLFDDILSGDGAFSSGSAAGSPAGGIALFAPPDADVSSEGRQPRRASASKKFPVGQFSLGF